MANQLGKCQRVRDRGKARIIIRKAASIYLERAEVGWSKETIDKAQEVELLRMFHSSRRKTKRRKKSGERK